MSVTFYAAGAPDDLDLNMCNRNAALVCESLGIDLDEGGWCGDMAADAFHGRVVMALALTPTDEGMPSYEHAGPGARMVEGARPAGYVQERLVALHELSTWAVAHQAVVSWA